MTDTTFWQAVTGLITTVRPVTILRSTQSSRENWQNLIEAGDHGDEFWIVDAGPTVEEDTATDVVAYRQPLTIFYCRSALLTNAEALAGTSIATAVEVVIESLREAFVAYTGTAFQLLARNPTRDMREDNPANMLFYALQARMQAGALIVEPMVGEYQ